MMRIAVSSYSYDQYFTSGKTDLRGVIECAARTGFEGIEFAGIGAPQGQTALEHAKNLKEQCRAAGLAVCGYAIAGDFASDDPDAEVKRLCGEVDIAAALGAPVMRTDILGDFKPGLQTMEQCRERVTGGIRKLAGYAQASGVLLTTENHSRIFCESARLEQLMDWVNHDNFRVLADLGNFMDAEEEPAAAVGRLARLIRHVHLKDFHRKDGSEFYPGEGWYMTRGGNYLRGAIVGHGDAQVLKCLKILDDAGYNGWLVLEFEGIEDPEMATSMGLKNTRRMLENLNNFRWNG